MQKSVVSTLKAVEALFRRAKYQWVDEPLDPINQAFIADLYTINSCIWYDVSLQPTLINERWATALAGRPVSDVVEAFKSIDDLLIHDRFTDYGSFKHYLRQNFKGLGDILSPLSENFIEFFDKGVGMQRLRTCLRFLTRANFPSPLKNIEEEAWRQWQEVNLSKWHPVDVSSENQVIREIFPWGSRQALVNGFCGRFGSGFSADARKEIEFKYREFGTDSTLNLIGNIVGFHPTEMPRCGTTSRTGSLSFVPKQLNKFRVVTMEPCSLMFYQLGLADCILKQIARSRWSRHIDLRHAELNQDLAYDGSLDGSYSTIDLSSASDSVKLSLTKELFRHTSLYTLLMGLRSKSVEYDGEIYTPEYYAPMGSGLCFPVECIVFASIVDSVMRRSGDTRKWRVYGDDIIVPDDRYDEVTARLVELGFSVNFDKSFHGDCRFRESCGGDYFWGEDCRPIYVSRFWPGLPHKVREKSSVIESNIALANELSGYHYARLRVIEGLKIVRPHVLFSVDGEKGIWSPTPTNFQAKKRLNLDLQRVEYKVGFTNDSSYSNPEFDDLRYFETMRLMSQRSQESFIRRNGRAPGYRCLCELGEPISISRSDQPVWSGIWDSPSPGWSTGESKDEPWKKET